ncbi:hypothetical protein EUX98_g7249 [Antrodiella citrinella]|uniref:FUN14 domain-containing protein n=1 Tax=Antrodiella citrinella TaxID=2447956 RepID=A0A4S4MNY9_9APHY|nr:hypothetical protein EUX98_g7249 [Antrodiella citrinella]
MLSSISRRPSLLTRILGAPRYRPHVDLVSRYSTPTRSVPLFSTNSPISVPAPIPFRHNTPYPDATNALRLRFSSLAAVAGIGIALTLYQPASTIHCDDVPGSNGGAPLAAPSHGPPEPAPLPPPPPSSVNLYELSFGTVCGVCAGVFVKNGAKLLAFAFGAIFVLLQYLGSQSLVRVDWTRMSQRFENLVFTKDAQGQARAPTIRSLLGGIIHFLTADFQQRASFVAGFALGLRLG